MDVNPNAQSLDALHWALAWKDAAPLGMLGALLERALFPRWLGVLYHWLAHGADFDEVTRWYLGWKVRVWG
jgi:tuftelin-interacting protein 11